jgi:hypothetical protein
MLIIDVIQPTDAVVGKVVVASNIEQSVNIQNAPLSSQISPTPIIPYY